MKAFERKTHKWILALVASFILAGGILIYRCVWAESNLLDPRQPVQLNLWHYRVGSAKLALDRIIERFNETEGAQRGIVIELYSLGSIDALMQTLEDAAQKKLGAPPLPDLFTAYNEHAYYIDQVYGIVSLEDYFEDDELNRYNRMFINGGRIGADAEFKNFPVAKSTDCLYLNQTDWERFAAETGTDAAQLRTWEGMDEAAAVYHRWSGGKAFWGMQNILNFIKTTAAEDRAENGVSDAEENPRLYYSERAARRIWKIYYEGSLRGYYSSEVEDSQSMNAMKRGDLLAIVASTAGAVYCPSAVLRSADEAYPIRCEALPYPHYRGGAKYASLRGNSFCIVKSDKRHEYAAALFLKWMTKPAQNIEYATLTGYLPVMWEALENREKIMAQSRQADGSSIVQRAQAVALEMLDDYAWRGNQVTEKTYFYDRLFYEMMTAQIRRDKAALERQEQEYAKEVMLNTYFSEAYFAQWYRNFIKKAARG